MQCDISVCRRCHAAMETSNLWTPSIAAFKGVLGRYPTEEDVRHPAICLEHGQSRLVPRFRLDLVLEAVRAHEQWEASSDQLLESFDRDMVAIDLGQWE